MSRWKVLNSKELFKAGLFRVRVDECQLPDGRVMPRYYTFEFPDWVNVVAVTPEKQLVLLRQYRHSAGEVFLEIPGGSTHAGESDGVIAAAKRELLEETGYAGGEWIDCGSHFPNPAMQNNRLHTFLVLNCVPVAEPSLDPYEDLVVELVPVEKLVDMLESGEFTHSLITASIVFALRQLRSRGVI